MAESRGEPILGLRERKKRRTRATLIDAAVGLCVRQGFDATTVDQIAAIADVSPRTFSRYFATKDAIALALIDEVLDVAAVELARQPREITNFEALRRAYVAMARNTVLAADGDLTSDRLLQILRIVTTSATLRQVVLEYRATDVDKVMAERMSTTVDDRRVRLMAAVWGAVLITATTDLAARAETGIDIDTLVAAFEETYREFAGEIVGIRQPV
ncbi:TetR family transcriptional regulator [Mycolicibacterium parafortuitum]|uniref:TetR family transcriptional regulator [Nocardia brasiliensis ATCC] n=1 Tax=Mycolicibacterium parafortuitum TaxID=39692 RepID=A0A375YSA9_MYCPF|nr:TetR family transcriptional regulator [Mycolicibacterium parafortuitum]ORB28970.1 TetR family transcriptional regulator [Mycolicibacterium parafortuitum]SRX83960.1 TetR family transcriptional regulator [Nocardia brasiliensis ATCC] [Mycolicibacterium parafortuitum]